MDRLQNNGSVKAVSPRHCAATSAPRNCRFNCGAGQSHKASVRCTAVEEQPEEKEIQHSQPSSTSLLMISSGLRVQLHLPTLDLAWNPVMCSKKRMPLCGIQLYSLHFGNTRRHRCVHRHKSEPILIQGPT